MDSVKVEISNVQQELQESRVAQAEREFSHAHDSAVPAARVQPVPLTKPTSKNTLAPKPAAATPKPKPKPTAALASPSPKEAKANQKKNDPVEHVEAKTRVKANMGPLEKFVASGNRFPLLLVTSNRDQLLKEVGFSHEGECVS